MGIFSNFFGKFSKYFGHYFIILKILGHFQKLLVIFSKFFGKFSNYFGTFSKCLGIFSRNFFYFQFLANFRNYVGTLKISKNFGLILEIFEQIFKIFWALVPNFQNFWINLVIFGHISKFFENLNLCRHILKIFKICGIFSKMFCICSYNFEIFQLFFKIVKIFWALIIFKILGCLQ